MKSVLVLCLTMSAVRVAAQPAPAIRFEPNTFTVEGVGPVEAELGRFTVPERRDIQGGRQIELVVGRLKATTARPGPPIVYLDGGPGGSGVGAARIPEYYRLFSAMRGIGDVLLLSQRGTGLSTPRLACPSPGPAPATIFESAEAMTTALLPRLQACVAEWRAKADLSAYTTEASADDVDDLRRALGVPTIHVFGFSYGTHLALSAIRRHPASIARAVLAGTEGPDHSQKLPHTFDLQLERLAALEAAQSPKAPSDLVAMTRALLSRLDATPAAVDVPVGKGGERTRLLVGGDGLRYLLRRDIGDTNDTASVIRLIRDTARGDLGMLARFAGRRYAELGGGRNVMAFAMDCASGVSAERLARIERERPGSLLGAMTNYPFPEVCGALDLAPLPAAYRAPIVSSVPTLFVSGDLDSNTPPYQAEEVRWGFPNGVHLVVERAGHESTVPLPEVQQAILDFLQGKDVRGRRLVAPSPLDP